MCDCVWWPNKLGEGHLPPNVSRISYWASDVYLSLLKGEILGAPLLIMKSVNHSVKIMIELHCTYTLIHVYMYINTCVHVH